jgi:hypothetical protein
VPFSGARKRLHFYRKERDLGLCNEAALSSALTRNMRLSIQSAEGRHNSTPQQQDPSYSLRILPNEEHCVHGRLEEGDEVAERFAAEGVDVSH